MLPSLVEESIKVQWNSDTEKLLAEDLHSKMECNDMLYGKLGLGDAFAEKLTFGR